jgi:hypothetical protein
MQIRNTANYGKTMTAGIAATATVVLIALHSCTINLVLVVMFADGMMSCAKSLGLD